MSHIISSLKRVLFVVVLFLSGCTSATLTVRTLYSSADKLPSVRVDTPDPLKPLQGRSHILFVEWTSPKNPSPLLDIMLRFQDETIIHEQKSLQGTFGTMSYEIDQSRIREHGSFLSYRMALVKDGKELASSEHKLWVTPIDMSENDESSPKK